MGTTYLLIILSFCNGAFKGHANLKCKAEKIACVRSLQNFDTDDVIDKCLQPEAKK